MHTHTHTHFSHPTKRKRNCRDWWEDEVVMVMKGAERSPGDLWSHQQDIQGSSGLELQIFIQAGAAFPASIPHLFSSPAPVPSLPCPHHFTLHWSIPHAKELTLFLCLRSCRGERDKQEKTEQAQPICAAETNLGTKQFSLTDRAVLYRKIRGN